MLIGGPDDGVITPWQSRYCIAGLEHVITLSIFLLCSHFGFYDESLNIQSYQKQGVSIFS